MSYNRNVGAWTEERWDPLCNASVSVERLNQHLRCFDSINVTNCPYCLAGFGLAEALESFVRGKI